MSRAINLHFLVILEVKAFYWLAALTTTTYTGKAKTVGIKWLDDCGVYSSIMLYEIIMLKSWWDNLRALVVKQVCAHAIVVLGIHNTLTSHFLQL